MLGMPVVVKSPEVLIQPIAQSLCYVMEVCGVSVLLLFRQLGGSAEPYDGRDIF